jgi:dTDP-glucose 4,6-dehydratase
MRLLVSGGCGFIGSHFIRYVLEHYQPEAITNIDALTYASSLSTTATFSSEFGDRYEFFCVDIADSKQVSRVLAKHSYFAVINFAAESQVGRNVINFENFVRSNVVGAATLLDAARQNGVKRFVQISTDEVYGAQGPTGRFTETAALNPSSPYAASKAAAELAVLAAHKTYGQDVVITRSSNNYGPFQFPDKLIPLMIAQALADQPLPVRGGGSQVRDWIHVEDHCAAVFDVLMKGHAGEIYNVSADNERRTIDLVRVILTRLGKSENLIQFVADRRGDDARYAIDANKLRSTIGWKPLKDFDLAFAETIDWYRQNRSWITQ